MRFIRNFFYLTGQGFVGVFRNSIMSTASILVLVCCMLITGTFGLVITAIDNSLDEINDMNVIVAYIDGSAAKEEIEQMKADILSAAEGLTVKFVDKETGLLKLKEDMGDQINLDIYTSGERMNPLPDTFEITFVSSDGAEALNNFINNLPKITETRHKIGLVEKFDNARNGLIAIAGMLMIVLLIVALFIIGNTIRLGVFARREEIAVMRYVGATNTFVVTPFIVEGILIGIVSSALAFGLQYYVYTYIVTDIMNTYGIGNVAPFARYMAPVAVGYAAIGLFAGTIAGGISVKKYLKN